MATDATGSIGYYLCIPESAKNQLANIRHWGHLKLGNEQGQVWVKGFAETEIQSIEVLSIPYKVLYREEGAKLYKLNSRLPDRNIPSLLWTGIDRAIPIDLPSFNHNFFGIADKVDIALVFSEQERPVVAQMVALDLLRDYLISAPQVRLNPIKWLIVGTEALLIGTPELPLNGHAYWRQDSFLVPAGLELSPSILVPSLKKRLNPDGEYWTLLKEDGSFFQVKKTYLKSLSLGSFRLSIRTKDHADESR